MKSRAEKERIEKQLEHLARQRGIERQRHFESGGTLVKWRGGTRTITTNRKKQQNKRACRGKWNG
jgi:dynactin complex subunit